VAKNFLGQRVSSCGATVTGVLRKEATSGGEGGGAEAGVSAVVTCDNSTGSAVYVLSIDEVVSDGKWLMSAHMDERSLVHRYGVSCCLA